MSMAKKIVKAVTKVVKKVAGKTAVKKVAEKVSEEVVTAVPISCSDCGGRGLIDQDTLCAHCKGCGTL